MAYTPTEWKCGDTITAEKLNKLEQAVANGESGAIIFSMREEEIVAPEYECPNPRETAYLIRRTYSHSWQELYDAVFDGRMVVLIVDEPGDNLLLSKRIVYIDALFHASDGEHEEYVVDFDGTYVVFPTETDKVWERYDCRGME